MYLAPNLIDQAEISKRTFEETQVELDEQDSPNSIINTVHRDKIILDQISEVINELGVVKWQHDLAQTENDFTSEEIELDVNQL